MCGIYCEFSADNVDKERSIINLKKLAHRGPDNTGFEAEKKFFIGHTRLSIVDADNANSNQPFRDKGKRYYFVFNGEIYNYKELKQQLESKGIVFTTSSDSEVVFLGLIEEGESFLKKIDGMYALVFYDAVTKEIYVARDHYGIKPLYLRINDGKVQLASEIKTFDNSKLCENSRILFLALGYIPEPYTLYEKVNPIKSGTITKIKITNGRVNISEVTIQLEEKLNLEIKDEIEKNVLMIGRHGIKPVLFYSGGLDSTVAAKILSRGDVKQDLISVVTDKDLDSIELRNLGLENTKYNKYFELIPDRDEKDFERFINAMDQPTIDGFNTYLITKEAHKLGYKVGLSGIGVDEFFYGYPSFKWLAVLKFIASCRIFRFLISIMAPKKGKYSKLHYITSVNKWGVYLAIRGVLSPGEISVKIGKNTDYICKTIFDHFDNEFKTKEKELSLKDVRNLEIHSYMKNQLFRDSDVFGMVNGVEVRPLFVNKNIDILSSKIDFVKSSKINKLNFVDLFKEMLNSKTYLQRKKGFSLSSKVYGIEDRHLKGNGWVRSYISFLDKKFYGN